MESQLELIERSALKLTPAPGRSEPALWIRRLVIWEKPGLQIRRVELKPGLNIVWSPDPAEGTTPADAADDALGHGGGKTLFCRMLRYVLGEDHFAPEAQRVAIMRALPEGLIGADVVVNGTPWAVVRAIRTPNRHVAVRNGDLDALSIDPGGGGGMAPFLEAVEAEIISADIAALLPGERPSRAWLIALAWLARDQQCRFAGVLEWRSASSDSGSPVRNLSATSVLEALRGLLGGLSPEELVLRAQIADLEKERSAIRGDAAHDEREAARSRERLLAALDLRDSEVPSGPLAVEMLRKAARTKANALSNSPVAVEDLDALRQALAEASCHAQALAQARAGLEARIPELRRLVSAISGELPGASVAVANAEERLCPVCDVPIDRALAEGCGLASVFQDPVEARHRYEARKAELARARADLDGAVSASQSIGEQLGAAQAQAGELGRRVREAERMTTERSESWYAARRLMDDVHRVEALYSAQQRSAAELEALERRLGELRDQAAAHRDDRARVFRRLSEIYDAVVRDIAGRRASGKVTLDGRGLRAEVNLGGPNSATALESLTVVAFDLAALCLSIEGATHLPAFLIHDIPREADLGLSAYHRLFTWARALESYGERPLFQYIVTTTTRPPANLDVWPWCRLTLRGAPAEERLLKCDL